MRALAVLAALALAAPAAAQAICGRTAIVEAGTALQFGEALVESVSRTLPDSGLEVEFGLWVNAATGSWTLTGTAGGRSCVLAGGLDGYAGQSIEDLLPRDDTAT